MTSAWKMEDMPQQSGRIVVVTGANSGLGLVATEAFAARGAQVIMACRATDKGARAADAIRQRHPQAQLTVAKLDTADLAAVHTFSDYCRREIPHIDLLINNAGIMAVPRELSRDGFELQFATNHLGHFALTGLLLERLKLTPGARIVTVTSLAAAPGSLHFDDLMGERNYHPWVAYNQSKLANLLFALELQRRLSRSGASTWSLAAHPGISTTNLFATPGAKLAKFFISTLMRFLAQPAEAGTLPTLFAATASEVVPGGYYGPTGFQHLKGPPGLTKLPRSARDEDVAARLWQVSEELTGVRFQF